MRFTRAALGSLTMALLLSGSAVLTASADENVEQALGHALTHSRVRAALVDRLGGYGLKIDIDVAGSRVTLKGDVKDAASLAAARRAAESVPGVAAVDVQLHVNPALESVGETARQEARDVALSARVMARLLAEIGANALKIEVKASKGVVTLTGSVSSPEVEKLAIRKASRTKGVRKVVNLLATS